MEEIWKDVIGYEGKYKISSKGRFMLRDGSVPGLVSNKMGNVVSPTTINRGSGGVRRNIGELVAESFLGYEIGGDFLFVYKDGSRWGNSVLNIDVSINKSCLSQGKSQCIKCSRVKGDIEFDRDINNGGKYVGKCNICADMVSKFEIIRHSNLRKKNLIKKYGTLVPNKTFKGVFSHWLHERGFGYCWTCKEYKESSCFAEGRRCECKKCKSKSITEWMVGNGTRISAKEAAAKKKESKLNKLRKEVVRIGKAVYRRQAKERDSSKLNTKVYAMLKNYSVLRCSRCKDLFHSVDKNIRCGVCGNIGDMDRKISKFQARSCKLNSNEASCAIDNLPSRKEVYYHLSSLYEQGMSDENYGIDGWHIDHIIPKSVASCENDMIRLNQLDNLRPMWGDKNEAKSDSINIDTYNAKIGIIVELSDNAQRLVLGKMSD